MADLKISEFQANPAGPFSGIPMAVEPAVTHQVISTLSGTSQQSAAFGSTTNLVKIYADVDVWALFATDPTATAAGEFLAAGEHWRLVVPGQKIAAITTS